MGKDGSEGTHMSTNTIAPVIATYQSVYGDAWCNEVEGCASNETDPEWCRDRPARDCYYAGFADTCCHTCEELMVQNAPETGKMLLVTTA